MDVKKAIKLLKELPETTGLKYPENWDDDPDVHVWIKESQEALRMAVKALSESNIVGTITINGKTYNLVD